MIKSNRWGFRIPCLFFAVTIFFSCNNSSNIPFPEKVLGYTQPVTVPLVFSASKKLKWDTARKGGITPVIKKFDIDALPTFPYDSTGFKPFSEPPGEVTFDFNKLPEKDFSLDKLPSHPLNFKNSTLGSIPTVKAGTPVMQKGKALAIYDFGKAQGMQMNFVGALYKDRTGLLWIGGREGLLRYDGEQVETFIQGSSSFNPIGGLIEDNAGKIWFVQAGDGTIGFIDPHKGTIGYSSEIGATGSDITRISKDGKGNIWIYNLKDKAMSVIDPVAETYRNVDMKAGLSDSLPCQMFQDDNKNIWVSTYTKGVNIIVPSTGKIKYLGNSNGLSNDSIVAITKDKNGVIWLAVPDGVNAVDIKNGTVKYYNHLQGFRKGFPYNLVFDSKGQLWKSTRNGIDLADFENQKIRHIDQSSGLSGIQSLAFVTDNYHRNWIGSFSGLSMIDQDGETVHIGAASIVSLMEDGANNLWIATQKGLFIVNPQRTEMHLLDKSGGLTDNFVQSFWNKNGSTVVATDGGFNIIDPINKTIITVSKKEGLVSDTVYAAFSDRSGNTWLTGPSKGIFLLDSAKKMILHTDVSGGLSDDAILDVKQDKYGLIWLATQRSGIDVVNPADGTVKNLNNAPGLKDTCLRMMLEDKYGRMWIGTDKGVYVADIQNGKLTSITTTQGLSDNTVLSLLEYNGTVLAGTNNKISMMTAPAPEDSADVWKISILNKSQGILKETNSWSTDAITHDGKYLWGDNGITVINQIDPSSDSVATYITGINVMGQPQYFHGSSADSINSGHAKYKWDSVSGAYNLPVNLSLDYNQNYVQFQFAQANLGRPDTTFYTYVLEGIDKNWSKPAMNPYTENYLNLPSGKYMFKVSSKGIDGTWSVPAEFKFTITPPWYQTWWAYTIFVLLILGFLRGYIIYRSRKLQKENKLLEEKVKYRTEQLQKSIEDLKSTQSQLIQSEKMASLGELTAGIAHEIQNPLNFVNNFSEVNIELADELKEALNATNLSPEEKLPIEEIANDIKTNQEKINFHGKRADSIVKGMLQHSRSSNGQKEPTNINTLADEYLRLAYHGLRAKDKSFNADMKTDFDENIPKINIVAQDVGRVILNLITNAFYAAKAAQTVKGKDYEPTVWVSTKKENGNILIKVKDNGTGIPDRVKAKIFNPFFTTKPAGEGTGLGLSLSYDIIKVHGGHITVESKEGEGTEFTVELPVIQMPVKNL